MQSIYKWPAHLAPINSNLRNIKALCVTNRARPGRVNGRGAREMREIPCHSIWNFLDAGAQSWAPVYACSYGLCLRMGLGAWTRCAPPERLCFSPCCSSICIWPLTKRVLTRKKSSTANMDDHIYDKFSWKQQRQSFLNAPAGMTIHNKFHVTNANKNCGDGSPSLVLSESNVLIRMTRL